MSAPITSAAELFAASAQDVEQQVRKDASGLDPAQIAMIVQLVLQYGPSVYTALLKLFHVTPKG